MKSRNNILEAIKHNQPTEVQLPEVPLFEVDTNKIEAFANVLSSIGGGVIYLNEKNVNEAKVAELFPTAQRIVSAYFETNCEVNKQSSIDELEKVDVAILKGTVGVAENGTIWVEEQNMLHRALPFITQHLVLVLDKNNLVDNMHQAYQFIQNVGNYGVFIAGPSKTADIEQSLVIGAHGARSLMVFLV